MTCTPEQLEGMLAQLHAVYQRDQRAEVSLRELQGELGLDAETARACVEHLTREGLAEADLFLVNVWVTLTPEGAAVVEQRAG